MNKKSVKPKDYLILFIAFILAVIGIICVINPRKEAERKDVETVTPIIIKHPESTKEILSQKEKESRVKKAITDDELSQQLAPGDVIDF